MSDSLDKIHERAGEFARAGVLLIRQMQEEGWTPADIEILTASDSVVVRAAALATIRLRAIGLWDKLPDKAKDVLLHPDRVHAIRTSEQK